MKTLLFVTLIMFSLSGNANKLSCRSFYQVPPSQTALGRIVLKHAHKFKSFLQYHKANKTEVYYSYLRFSNDRYYGLFRQSKSALDLVGFILDKEKVKNSFTFLESPIASEETNRSQRDIQIAQIQDGAAFVIAEFLKTHESMYRVQKGETLSLRQLEDQAVLLGKEVETKQVAYRLDTRRPEVIKELNGFGPNPKKPHGDIIEHIKLSSNGTSSFVSLTLAAGNGEIIFQTQRDHSLQVLDDFLSESDYAKFRRTIEKQLSPELLKKLEGYTFHESRSEGRSPRNSQFKRAAMQLVELRSKPLTAPSPSQLRIKVIYEYQIRNQAGVEIKSGNTTEKEFVTNFVPLSNILSYRPIYIIESSIDSDASFYLTDFKLTGQWRPLD